MSDESQRPTDERLPEGPWPPAGFLRKESLTPSEAAAIEERLLAQRPGAARRPWLPAAALAASLLMAAGISLLLTRPLPEKPLPVGHGASADRSSVLRISRTDQPDRPPYVLVITYRSSSRTASEEDAP